MIAEPRPLPLPAPDSEVDVVALRERPPVAARDDSDLEHEPPRVAGPVEPLVGAVPLERDSELPLREPERPCRDAVHPVRPDERPRADPMAADRCVDSLVVELDPVHLR